ncbi:hypothetical protein EYF80_032622 [Liparis tanakae]|uniref:Uncharacterized protein n=1 Tax=Liparis tanakae TaxID=230148 RepID=A0A4Z2GWS5_9TELE|nr:hypothetical protein EYF80_032622 [Liparis tanakae]
MLTKTMSMQRHWEETTAQRRAPSGRVTHGVSSRQKLQPGWHGRQSLEEPSSALGPLAGAEASLPNVCVCVSIISREKKPAASLCPSRASGFPPGREAGIEKLKEMKCPRVYISLSLCDLTRIHRHGVNTREMDLYV